GGIECEGPPCYRFVRSEMVARLAEEPILALYDSLSEEGARETEIEMLTRSIELGPNWETFDVRGGALRYAPFDRNAVPDRAIFDESGAVLSPIDEFNAPVGAAFCGEGTMGQFGAVGRLPGVDDLRPYMSCADIDDALGFLRLVAPGAFEPAPICGTTRTTVSALRIGDFLLAGVPGEPVTLYSEALRQRSPFDAAHTVVIGYAQDHIGYLLTPEDWLQGGSSETGINVWGPLEGERIAEETQALMELAVTPEREDGSGEAGRYVPPSDPPRAAEPAPLAGTVPSAVPEEVYVRARPTLASAQPAATVPRLRSAYFVWIGADPVAGTPTVILEREVEEGVFDAVRRPSGRRVIDGDLLVTHTPQPLTGDGPRTHYWAVEWQAVGLGHGNLEGRLGLPLGTYRFRIEGPSYDLASDAFEVTPGELVVRVEGERLVVEVDAPGGFRLLHPTLPSNGPVPLFSREVSVAVDGMDPVSLTLAEDGSTSIPIPSARVRVTDAFGNTGEWAP
ncbi:MAG: hypothetical protein AAF645_28470, partial [Myxococcota bacterium]